MTAIDWFDFFDLNWGGLDKIRIDRPAVQAESLFGMFYEDPPNTRAHPAGRRFPYDWRQPIQALAESLAGVLSVRCTKTHPISRCEYWPTAFGEPPNVSRSMRISGMTW